MPNKPQKRKSHEGQTGGTMDAYTLSLTEKEVCFIDEKMCLAFLMQSQEGEEGLELNMFAPVLGRAVIPAPPPLLEIIGNAFLWVTDPDHEGEEALIECNSMSLQIIREISLLKDSEHSQPVKISLRKKVYKALYGKRYDVDKVSTRLLSGIDCSLSDAEFPQDELLNKDVGRG